MLYVSNVTYFVLHNGDQVGLITLGRELRQRDLLSPFLFIILLKAYPFSLKRLPAKGIFIYSKFAEVHLWCRTYYLHMIVSFFIGPQFKCTKL